MCNASRKAASATRALNAELWVRRVRRADFLTIKNACSPGLSRPDLTPGVSTYRAVQICGATSVARGIGVKTVAKFVDNPQGLARLRAIGVH